MNKRYSGMAVASLVLGICSVFLFWTFIVPALAIIFGIVGLGRIKKDSNLEGKSLAIVGIVLGSIGIVFVLSLVFIGIAWTFIAHSVNSDGGNLISSDSSNGETSKIDAKTLATLCLDLSLSVKNVENLGNGYYSVTLMDDSPTGKNFESKINFFSDSRDSGLMNFGSFSLNGEEKTKSFDVGFNANKIQVTPYVLDDNGNEYSCSFSREYKF